MPEIIRFVTGNENKIREARHMLSLPVEAIYLDLDEIQTDDLEVLVQHKARQAYAQVKQAVMVEDTSLYFEAWNQLPGPMIKWFLKNLGLQGTYQALEPFENKAASAVCVIGFATDAGVEVVQGQTRGQIVFPRGELGFGWDALFQPEGSSKTLGEMPLEEKKQFSMRRRALEAFEVRLKNIHGL